MKTIRTINIIPVFVELIPAQEEMEEHKVYVIKGEWTLTQNGDKITMSPSIANYQMPYKSHYIITNNKANFV